ncbi:hypothetical protein, partial [Streptomyces sp. NPDC056670]|uniref:hypothetical protein n=1 Tax=Streptomyces sp. NPDC056670 TaxID=3345904 RepID=UPI00368E8ADC
MQYIAYIRGDQPDALFDLDEAEKFLGHVPADCPSGTSWDASLHLTQDGLWILNEVKFGDRVNAS